MQAKTAGIFTSIQSPDGIALDPMHSNGHYLFYADKYFTRLLLAMGNRVSSTGKLSVVSML